MNALDRRSVACLALLILAVLVRLPGIDQLPRFDELYTLPAATHWATEGMPRIANGIYDRALLYTAIIGEWFRWVEPSLIMARLPSVLFGSLLVIAVFLWTDLVVDRPTAWVAGLFVALDPLGIEMSQYARFYALHALLFWLGASLMYLADVQQFPGWRKQLAAVVAGMICIVVATQLQVITLIGMVGVAVWAVGLLLWQRPPEMAIAIAAGLVAAGVGALTGALLMLDEPWSIVERYFNTPLTVTHHAAPWFYHLHLIEQWPTLWPVLPFLAFAAVAVRPKPTLFALTVFAVVFVLMSFAGHRSWHLLYFVMPFLFVVWSIALVGLWHLLRDLVLISPTLSRKWTGALLAGACLFLVLSNGAPARTLLRPFGFHLGEGFSADWAAAGPQLEPLIDDDTLVVTSNELHTLHYFGRADVVLSKERLAEVGDREFDHDIRTGLPVISNTESLDLILSCYPRVLILTDTIKGWRAPTVIDDDVADLIAAYTEPVPVPERTHVKAFRWRGAFRNPSAAQCGLV